MFPFTLPRWPLLLLLGSLLLGTTARGQAPANDDPCGAIGLILNGNLCTNHTVGSNAGATATQVAGHTSPTPGCGSGGNQPRDVWYYFTTAATGLSSFGATITVTGNPAGQLRLYAAPACTGPFTLLECAAATAPNTAAPRLVTAALQPGRSYYVAVNGYADADQTGAFTVCLTDGPGTPTCGAPVFLGSGSVNATSAQINFRDGANGGGPYQATLTGGGSTRSLNVAASPLQLTGLTPATTYQLTLAGQCAGGPSPSAGFSFTTPTAYCLAGLGGSCSANYITAVSILATSLNNAAQIPTCDDGHTAGGGPLQAYTFYPPTRPSNTATLTAGTTYQLAVAADGNSSVSAWLDADHNGAFDPNEWTQVALATQNGQASVASLLVPATALPGATGLRIRSRTAGSPNTSGAACAGFASGEVEDYTVTIAAPTAARAAAGSGRLSAYPNPASEVVTIAYSRPLAGSQAGVLHVYDAIGREIYRQLLPAASKSETEVMTKNWQPGLYTFIVAWADYSISPSKVQIR